MGGGVEGGGKEDGPGLKVQVHTSAPPAATTHPENMCACLGPLCCCSWLLLVAVGCCWLLLFLFRGSRQSLRAPAPQRQAPF